MKLHQLSLDQSSIEFLDGCLSYYQNQLHPYRDDPMRKELLELRTKLNESLPCEAPECDRPRHGMDEYCNYCEAVRDDAYRTYRGAVQAGMIEGV